MPQEPSSSLTSEQMKQQIEETDVEETTQEVVEAEGVEATEESESETEQVETEETETKPAKKEDVIPEKFYKLKVKGKELEVTEDKLIALAQQGEDYSIKMGKLKDWEKDLQQKAAETTSTPFGNISPEKFNEFLIKNLNEDPGGTLLNLWGVMKQNDEKAGKEEKRQERAFKTKAEETFGELWSAIRSGYEEYREDGQSREAAFAMARADFYQDIATRAMQRGMKKGATKAEAKLRSEIPSGTKKTKVSTGLPTPEQTKKMSSKEMSKYLKRFQNPGW